MIPSFFPTSLMPFPVLLTVCGKPSWFLFAHPHVCMHGLSAFILSFLNQAFRSLGAETLCSSGISPEPFKVLYQFAKEALCAAFLHAELWGT